MLVTFDDMFPTYRAVVLHDGHVDRITGPRCMVQMLEGPQIGLYFVAHTDEIIPAGTPVLVHTYRMRAVPCSPEPPHCDKCEWLHWRDAKCMDAKLNPIN